LKIQHWAIVCIIILLPYSIITRSLINKKIAVLKDETRYNNILDNATYDACEQIKEVFDFDNKEKEHYKNITITKDVADQAINRFFMTLAVNFNLPYIANNNDATINSARSYFAQYIPAIIIVGYDGLYVCSFETTDTNGGYDFTFKPKIPYSESLYDENGNEVAVINYTLDNYVSLYIPDVIFGEGLNDIYRNPQGTHILSGFVGENLDVNSDGVDDLRNKIDMNTFDISWDKDNSYVDDDGYSIFDSFSASDRNNYLKNTFSTQTDNLSYYLYCLHKYDPISFNFTDNLQFIISNNDSDVYEDMKRKAYSELNYNTSNSTIDHDYFQFSDINQDYEYNDFGQVTALASDFHTRRRNCIINLLQEVLTQEFNEHNTYADVLGLTYNFSIPDIGRDQWNNTIDDISVLSFIQGIPVGYDEYYNNFSLGGTSIVKSSYLYGEAIRLTNGEIHHIYHKEFCKLVPRDKNGSIIYAPALYYDDTYNSLVPRNYNGPGNYKKYIGTDQSNYGLQIGFNDGCSEDFFQVVKEYGSSGTPISYYTVPSWDNTGPTRWSIGIEEVFVNSDDAYSHTLYGIYDTSIHNWTAQHIPYYACSECM